MERSPDHGAPHTRRVGVLLAGGEGRRFAGPTHKLLTVVGGRQLFEWGLAAIRGAGLDPWIVWGALAGDPPATPADVVALTNPRWREGMATSVRVAIDLAREIGLDALTFGPADQPGIPAAAWGAVDAAPATIAVATYGGKRGNPVKLGQAVWDAVPSTGDVGGRAVMELHPGQVVEVACQGNPADIDTLEDLDRWNSSTTSP